MYIFFERKFYVAKADSEINFRKAKIYFERSRLTAKLSPLIEKVLFNVGKSQDSSQKSKPRLVSKKPISKLQKSRKANIIYIG